MKNKTVLKITLSGMLLAIGIVLPFLTGQIPEIGAMLCPMHIPVIICGFICGWKYGLIVGLILPILRSIMFSMPPMYPGALSFAFEFGTYGLVSGLGYELIKKMNKNNIIYLYIVLIITMLLGRTVWGAVRYIMALIDNTIPFSFTIFLSGAFVTAWPGIILQLVLIPILVNSLKNVNIIK